MLLLREWFVWGESDLFIYGVLMIVVSALLPFHRENVKDNYNFIATCLAIYAICEVVVTLGPPNWTLLIICLFAGGIALSIALGRIVRMVWAKFRK
ncbi:MAG: hypothetical protein LUF00_10525 [Lachnospiraceae bacterium]|nr:hypothetical protein [Lachnospiraceae bacterium]